MKKCSVCMESKDESEFYDHKSTCKLCYRENKTNRDSKNRTRINKWMSDFRNKNKERFRKMRILWDRKYVKEHPEVNRMKRRRRRALEKNSEGIFTQSEWVELCHKFNDRCIRCGKTGDLTADHIIPISKGGRSDISNIQPMCNGCNKSKKDKTIDYR